VAGRAPNARVTADAGRDQRQASAGELPGQQDLAAIGGKHRLAEVRGRVNTVQLGVRTWRREAYA